MTTDDVPTIDVFRPWVLRVLSDGRARPFSQVCEQAADLAGLSEAARAQTVKSGQPRYINRVTWACSALVKAGLVTRPRRGWYEITDDGTRVDARRLSSYSEEDMLEWPMWRAYQEEIASRRASSRGVEESAAVVDDEVSALERISNLVDRTNDAVATDLRRRLQEASPEFFEQVVVDLLWAMGYGGAHGEKQRVGRSGDGGVDGVIKQDALGLHNVYIQAKRYADGNTVQRPAIQGFYGALQLRGAERGVFITTSTFSDGARQAAHESHGAIVLIDGLRLTELMVNYGVAVRKIDEFTVYEVDDDFFEGAAIMGGLS